MKDAIIYAGFLIGGFLLGKSYGKLKGDDEYKDALKLVCKTLQYKNEKSKKIMDELKKKYPEFIENYNKEESK